MTVLTTRTLFKMTQPINHYQYKTYVNGTVYPDYVNPTAEKHGKLQRIKEYDKAVNAKKFKAGRGKELVINRVEIVKVETVGDGFELSANGPNGSWEKFKGFWTHPNVDPTYGLDAPFEAMPSWIASYATQKAYAKMASPEDVDLGQAIGELSETLTFLRNPLKGLIQHATKHQKAVTKKLLKRNVRASWGMDAKTKATLTADILAESWLSYLYGYKTLMSDLDGIINLLTGGMIAINNRIRAVGGVVESDGAMEQSMLVKVISGTPILGYAEQRKLTSWKASTKLFYRYRPWMVDAIALGSLGLSPAQWLTTAWAITPGSFIVDWAVDISTWLRAAEPRPHVELLGGCTSSVTTEVIQHALYKWGTSYNLGYTRSYYPLTGIGCTRERKRLIRGSVTPPSFTPVMTRRFEGFNKTLAAISLLWTFRPKILRRGLVFQDF